MKIRNVQRHGDEKIELQMTPMIDIVFQLLAFFILTFQIIPPEGDFNIKMPLAAPSPGDPPSTDLPPIKIRLRAAAGGALAGIQMSQRTLRDFKDLHLQIRGIVDDSGGPGSPGAKGLEVELDCDYDLKFEYAMDAITAVSGFTAPDGIRIKELIEKIKFSPTRLPGATGSGE